MPKWIPCGEDFITGDVIRWVEPIWKPKTRKGQKSVKIGKREIIAQVQRCEPEGWVDLSVKSNATEVLHGWTAEKLDEVIRRRRGPIGLAGAERLLWSDESARALVASRYMGPPPDEVHPRSHPGATPRLLAGRSEATGQRRGRHVRRKGPRPRPRPPSG